MQDMHTGQQVPADFDAWRRERWDEIAGPNGKAKVVAKGMISGSSVQMLPGIPGEWSTDAAGALTVTASAADGVTVGETLVDGTVVVPSGSALGFSGGRAGMAGGANGAYGVVVTDPREVERLGLSGIDSYAYDPAWVFEGYYRAAAAGRQIEVERLTSPPSTDRILGPLDLVVTIDGVEYVLTVLEEQPGQRLVVFTDETSGNETPGIGRWLTLPDAVPGEPLVIDFNKATLSYHHLQATVFTCPLSPEGNHLPLRITAGERSLVFDVRAKAVTYLRHLENRDWDAARAMCTAAATVWHNDGKGDESIDANISGMQAQIGAIESMRYDVQRQLAAGDEVLQQHVVHVATKDGRRGEVHAAVYFRFDGGLISRIEEYANFVPAE
ncbi:hypothetical protein GCM10009534_23370 [Kribbella sandramycini]